MGNRKEESREKEYINYTECVNNYNISWMSKERRSKYIRTRSGSAIHLDNVELVDGNEIKKVKFLQFDKNISTQTWRATVELNSKYDVSLTENYIGGELRFSGFYAEEISIRKQGKRTINKNNIEIIYVKDRK